MELNEFDNRKKSNKNLYISARRDSGILGK